MTIPWKISNALCKPPEISENLDYGFQALQGRPVLYKDVLESMPGKQTKEL